MDNRKQPPADRASLRWVTDTHTPPTLCVRLPDLQQTVTSLGAVEDRLAGATRRVGGLGPAEAGDVGPDLDAFADHWEHGVSTLRHGVAALRTALEQVHSAYAAHEHGLVEQLGGSA